MCVLGLWEKSFRSFIARHIKWYLENLNIFQWHKSHWQTLLLNGTTLMVVWNKIFYNFFLLASMKCSFYYCYNLRISWERRSCKCWSFYFVSKRGKSWQQQHHRKSEPGRRGCLPELLIGRGIDLHKYIFSVDATCVLCHKYFFHVIWIAIEFNCQRKFISITLISENVRLHGPWSECTNERHAGRRETR